MRVNSAGELYIGIGHQLYRFGAAQEFIAEYNLSKIGIEQIGGDIAFFTNGDMLIYRPVSKPSVLQNIATYLRLTNDRPLEVAVGDGGLMRCQLGGLQCQRFSEAALDLGRAFSLYFDEKTDEVYLSDTSRHTVRKFNSEGQQLASRSDGFRFPNRLLLKDEQLVVADTNHHTVHMVSSKTETFAETLDQMNVIPYEARQQKEIWPYALLPVADKWWLTNLETDMSYGGVYIFDQEWNYLWRLDLPDHADPLDLVDYNSRVLINDYYQGAIYQFDYFGERLEDFAPAPIGALLQTRMARREQYQQIETYLGWSFAAFLTIAFVVAFLLTGRQKVVQKPISAAEQQLDVSAPDIVWLQPNTNTIRRLKWLGGVVVLLILTALALTLVIDKSRFYLITLAGLATGFLLLFFVL